MDNQDLEVNFKQYCSRCEHFEEKGEDRFNEDVENDFCDECLAFPMNQNSHKPINFNEK